MTTLRRNASCSNPTSVGSGRWSAIWWCSTPRAHLLHESGLMPVVYAPEDDFSDGVWAESTTSTHCPFKGDAAYRSLQVDGTTVDDLQWRYPNPVAPSS